MLSNRDDMNQKKGGAPKKKSFKPSKSTTKPSLNAKKSAPKLVDKKFKPKSDTKRDATISLKRKPDAKEKYQVLSKEAPKTVSQPRKKFAVGGAPLPKFGDDIRLNKYISNAGVCSRREADVLIQTGVVSVNGKVVTELGYKIKPTDKVTYDGETIKHNKKQYVLVNKPEDFDAKPADNVTKKSKSVYQIIKKACPEYLYPVGKLNINECGLILYTNDTDLERKLTHPGFKVSQLFHIVLNKDMEMEHLLKMKNGMFVEDKMFSVADISHVAKAPKNEIGVKVYSNKTSLVKTMLKKLGYEIVKFDRVEFAGLDKWDLARGNFRHLTKKEVISLQMAK